MNSYGPLSDDQNAGVSVVCPLPPSIVSCESYIY